MIDVALSELSKWLAATPLSHTIQTTSWIIPTIQIIHILGVAVVCTENLIRVDDVMESPKLAE